MNSRRQIELLVALLMVVLVWLSYAGMASSRQQFESISAEQDKTSHLAHQIEQLRSKPDQATLESHSERALARAIEQSASEVGIVQTRIARIEPQAARRAGDSSYMEHATLVQLESVTLKQIAHLVERLRQLDASLGQLHITTLRIDAPYQQDAGSQSAESWNIEFTLTYFVYSPKSPTSRTS